MAQDPRDLRGYGPRNPAEETCHQPHAPTESADNQHARPQHPPSLAAGGSLPSMYDHRAPPYGAPHPPPPPPLHHYPDPRAVPTAAYPMPPADPNAYTQQQPPHQHLYLPPVQHQPDLRMPYAPAYYVPAHPQPYAAPYYAPQAYSPGRAPYPPEYSRVVVPPAPMPQAAQAPPNTTPPRQRTSIACRYCRKRKIRCSGYQNTMNGKCTNCDKLRIDCIFQPVSSNTTAFVPIAAVPGGVPPGTTLYGAYGQPLPAGTITAASITSPSGATHSQPQAVAEFQQPLPSPSAAIYPQHLVPAPASAPLHAPVHAPVPAPAAAPASATIAAANHDDRVASSATRPRVPEEEQGTRLPAPVPQGGGDDRRRSPSSSNPSITTPPLLYRSYPPPESERTQSQSRSGNSPGNAPASQPRAPTVSHPSHAAHVPHVPHAPPAANAQNSTNGPDLPNVGTRGVMSLGNLMEHPRLERGNEIDQSMLGKLNQINRRR